MLALEFWPSDGNPVAIFAVVALLLWRYVSGHWTSRCLNNPIFMVAALGWLFGLHVNRFFTDWGAPALLLWMALELTEHMERFLPTDCLRRLLITVGLGLGVAFMFIADNNSRWTKALSIEYLSEADPEMKPWLPEPGGILYSSDMSIFYQTFFRNPHARWRYLLGFEPTFMPPDDLRIYRGIQQNLGSYQAYEPWVRKMRPPDRMAIRSDSPTPPSISGLEWHYTAREIWIGRTPR
jgi:hypothetical protein